MEPEGKGPPNQTFGLTATERKQHLRNLTQKVWVETLLEFLGLVGSTTSKFDRQVIQQFNKLRWTHCPRESKAYKTWSAEKAIAQLPGFEGYIRELYGKESAKYKIIHENDDINNINSDSLSTSDYSADARRKYETGFIQIVLDISLDAYQRTLRLRTIKKAMKSVRDEFFIQLVLSPHPSNRAPLSAARLMKELVYYYQELQNEYTDPNLIILHPVRGYDPAVSIPKISVYFTTKEREPFAKFYNNERALRNLPTFSNIVFLSSTDIPPKSDQEPRLSSENVIREEMYDHTVLGGTFDHLHAGHKIMLSVASYLASQSVTIGITSSEMLEKKKHKEEIESYEVRERGVAKFLHTINPLNFTKTSKLIDGFGPSTVDPLLGAIVSSGEDTTKRGCDAINQTREKSGMSRLDIFPIDLLKTPKFLEGEEKLSSTSIRNYLLTHRDQK